MNILIICSVLFLSLCIPSPVVGVGGELWRDKRGWRSDEASKASVAGKGGGAGKVKISKGFGAGKASMGGKASTGAKASMGGRVIMSGRAFKGGQASKSGEAKQIPLDIFRAAPGVEYCYVNSTTSKSCTETDATSSWNKGDCKDGKRQSPIDIKGPTKIDYKNGCPLDFGLTEEGAYDFGAADKAKNSGGLTVSVTPGDSAKKATFRWPDKDFGEYTLAQFHFHWGNDTTGSEHLIDGKRYPLEVHLVHYRSGKKGYPDLGEAVKSGKGDALAVIGILFEADGTDDILKNIKPSAKADEEAPLAGDVKFSKIIKAETEAYHYEGSLTTPGCNELVQWIVLKTPVKVPAADIKQIRDANPNSHTFRKAQELNSRPISTLELSH